MTIAPPPVTHRIRNGIGTSPIRPDGIPKLKGEFAYSSDIHEDGMLWGATRRSPYAHARITKPTSTGCKRN